jgi:antitoxin component of MazEF toxin-antitoxin module
MKKRLVRHGNSRALVIDKAILELLKIDDDTELEVTTDGRSLTIRPSGAADERLQRLIDVSEQVMDENDGLFRRLAE